MHNLKCLLKLTFCILCFPICDLKSGSSKVQKKAILGNKSNYITKYSRNISFISLQLALF